jgi:hypothetical protein
VTCATLAVMLMALAVLAASRPVDAMPSYVIAPVPGSCGGWGSAKKQTDYKPSDNSPREQYSSWVLGFLTG